MKNLLKPILLSGVFLLSLSSCAKSATDMVESLRNNDFEVEHITREENEEIKALDALLNLGLFAAGYIEDVKEGVTVNSMAVGVKVDEEGAHGAQIVEFGSGDEAGLFYKFYDENKGADTEIEFEGTMVQVGSCLVSYTDDYTKGVLGI